jgi:flagellar biogenesis protein FliO
VRFGQEDILLGVTAQSVTRLGSTPTEVDSTRQASRGD